MLDSDVFKTAAPESYILLKLDNPRDKSKQSPEEIEQYKQLSAFTGEDRNPVFSADGRSLYYLSEEKGSFNVFRMPVGGGASTQVTFLKDYPVRSLSMSNDGTLCFNYRGEVYMQKEGGQPVKLNVRFAADTRYNPEVTKSVNGRMWLRQSEAVPGVVIQASSVTWVLGMQTHIRHVPGSVS